MIKPYWTVPSHGYTDTYENRNIWCFARQVNIPNLQNNISGVQSLILLINIISYVKYGTTFMCSSRLSSVHKT